MPARHPAGQRAIEMAKGANPLDRITCGTTGSPPWWVVAATHVRSGGGQAAAAVQVGAAAGAAIAVVVTGGPAFAGRVPEQ